MYINAIGHYIPSQRIENDYFEKITGKTDEWFVTRTGIRTRSRAGEGEDNHTMGLAAVADAVKRLPYPAEEVDLVIHASYSPLDTVGTLAHVVQREYNMTNAKAFYISSACSTFVNAVEIVQSFFKSGIATKALIVASEHNTMYSNDQDVKSGHLWGDGAAAVFMSKDKTNDDEAEVIDTFSRGLGHVGKGPMGVYLQPGKDKLVMPDGRDVFQNACGYMIEALEKILSKNGYAISDLQYIIPHQANKRITMNVAYQLNLPLEMFLSNIEELGNTGCASTPLVLSQNWELFKKGDLIGLTVFGGGYSSGSILIKR